MRYLMDKTFYYKVQSNCTRFYKSPEFQFLLFYFTLKVQCFLLMIYQITSSECINFINIFNLELIKSLSKKVVFENVLYFQKLLILLVPNL